MLAIEIKDKWIAYVFAFVLGLTFVSANTKLNAHNITPELETKKVTINDIEINYRIGGNGPVLLLLHGYTLSGEAWKPFVKNLINNYKLIIPDLPGHGSSSSLRGNYTITKFADIITAFMNELGIKQFNAVGHSAGAMTLIFMAQENSERINSMVLIGCGSKFSKNGLKFAESDTFENLSGDLLQFYKGIHKRGDEQLKELYDSMMPVLYSYQNFDIFSDEFKNMKTRSLLITGDSDNYFNVNSVVDLYNFFPYSQLWIIPGGGHAPVWKDWGGSPEASEIFTLALMRFINSPKEQNNFGLN
ncbi:MAG: alpha/beta hydrolase [Bacteroidetes bacterium]|nr:alpha/beta hydrolase [Bacteroidota bacterium]